MTKRQARKILLDMAKSLEPFENAMMDPEARKVISVEAQMLADDSRQPQYVQTMFQAYGRGRAARKSGLTPGQYLDREISKHPPPGRPDASSP